MSDEKPKSLKKKIIYSAVAVLCIVGLGNAFIENRKLENLAADRGFESVQEFKAAQREDISTKSEYDAYLQKKDKAESEAAAQGGFLSVDEYKKAQYVNMPTKALYDKYLEQQAELKLAEEKREAEEAEKARLAKAEEEKRKAEEAEKARLAEAEEEKRKTEEAEQARLAKAAEEMQKMLATNAEARELFELTEHISRGGSYALIEISDIDAELFSGKRCSEALGLRASLKPVKGSHPFGFVVNGTSGEIAEISTVFSFGDDAPTYKMPNGCNIFASPAQVERSCGLDDPKYVKEVYELDEETGIVAKFGRLKRIGGDKEENTWKVVTRNDGETLTSSLVNIHRMSVFMNKPLKVERRTYICRG